MQNSSSSTDLPQHFTDATRAILVDWLIQVHVSLLYVHLNIFMGRLTFVLTSIYWWSAMRIC